MKVRPRPSIPDEAALREAALAHMARYATTRAGLLRVLNRRIDRAVGPDTPAEARAVARAAALRVADRLVELGVIDDAAFAARRAAGALRTGRSPTAARAALRARGVAPDIVQAVTEAPAEAVFAAALILTKKRRIGPFRAAERDPAMFKRELGVMARAGFPEGLARRALNTDRDEAESLITAFRRD